VFDCDGVLVDSEPLHDAATRDELEHRGIALPNSFFDEHVGMRVADQMAVLAARHGFDPDNLYAAREQRFWTLVRTRFAEVPGSVDTVRRLHAAGIKIAVATSGTRRWIDYVIDRLGLEAEIAATISGEDVHEPKPHPEAYLMATAALGVAPRQSAVVEDSERGYRAAVEAGCIVVVLNRHGREPHRFTDATAVTTSMPHARDVLLRAATHGVD
jgi:HAD superfamily hydrolase (TIGR01509 family)